MKNKNQSTRKYETREKSGVRERYGLNEQRKGEFLFVNVSLAPPIFGDCYVVRRWG